MIKAMLYDKDIENIWVKNFNPIDMTGILDNIPLSNKYKLGDKVKIRKVQNHYEIEKLICPNKI